jgi:NhaP-type Na+/H+ or K+/H+ antiporter
MDMTTIAVITLGLLVFVAHGLESVFARTKIPDVLILLFIGLFLGPLTGLVVPEHMGNVAPVFTTLTLVIILFEGGLGLNLKVLGRSLVGATGLTIWSFVATLAIVAPIAHFAINLTWLQSLILAATLGGTSSAVVIPVVKHLALGEKARTILTLESALSDVLVIVVSLALLGAMEGGDILIGRIFGGMVASFFAAGVLGCLAGLFWSIALHWLHGLKKSIFTTPAFVLVVYGVVESMGFSGAIAALLMGIVLGNIRALPVSFLKKRKDMLENPTETEVAVFEEVAFLLKTLFFVYIGISIQLSSTTLIYAGLGIAAALFVLRVPVVHASLIPKASFSRFEAAISGAMNPKGLAAAVAASVPLHREMLHGKEGQFAGKEIQLTVFAVVLFTIIVTSVLVFLIERGWFASLAKMLYGRYEDGADPIEKVGFGGADGS